jgi:hypothetical protein
MGELPAILHLNVAGCAIHRGAALDGIQNKHLFAGQLAGRNDLVEELTCGADEWLALGVFFLPRCFAQKTEAGLCISDPEDSLPAVPDKFRAAAACGNLGL